MNAIALLREMPPLTQARLKTMPLGLCAFFGEDTAEWDKIMAATALSTLPTLLLSLP